MSSIRLSNAEYALEFVEVLPASYTCTNCHQFLGEPYQNVECGDRFCGDCVGLITNAAKKCPQCSSQMTKETTFIDAAVRREIGELEVCCPFKRYDCGETLLYRNLVAHIEACSKRPVGASAGNSPAVVTALEIEVDELKKTVQDLQLTLDGIHNQVSSLMLWKCSNAMNSGDGDAGAARPIREMTRRLGRWLKNQVFCLIFWKSNNTISSVGGDAGAVKPIGEMDRQLQTAEEIAQGASPVDGANAHEIPISWVTASLENLLATVDIHEQTSRDSLLIWKIDNYRQRKTEAVDGVRRWIRSSPFYSHRCGYKMRACVYLNGIGRNENVYLSLFIVLMKGEYDAILGFPFRRRVKFTLVDQDSHSRNWSVSFDPAPAELNFQRPTGDVNIGAGCPTFVQQSIAETPTYLKDDCIYLRIAVGID